MFKQLDSAKVEKLLLFSAGIVTTVIGVKVQKNPKTRKTLVNTLAKCMQLQKNAQETIMNLKEEAEDICVDAKKKAEQVEVDGK